MFSNVVRSKYSGSMYVSTFGECQQKPTIVGCHIVAWSRSTRCHASLRKRKLWPTSSSGINSAYWNVCAFSKQSNICSLPMILPFLNLKTNPVQFRFICSAVYSIDRNVRIRLKRFLLWFLINLKINVRLLITVMVFE